MDDKLGNTVLKCQDCGIISSDVRETTCPFDIQINNIRAYAILCRDCLRNKLDAID